MRALALGLEALRAVDRYGVTKHGEQYKGWKALPGADQSSATMTAEMAARFIAQHSGMSPHVWGGFLDAAPVLGLDPAYRMAAKKLHPDAGGSVDDFQRLQEAKRVLDLHHGRGAKA